MKTVWKWVLGILAVLVVLGVLAVAPLIWHQFLPYGGYGMAHGYWQAGRRARDKSNRGSWTVMGGGGGRGDGVLLWGGERVGGRDAASRMRILGGNADRLLRL